MDRVILPSREEIRYECDGENPIGPARKFRNGKLVAEYLWLDALRLSGCLDHERQLEYAFSYGKSGGMPDRVRVTPLRSPGWRTGAQRRAGAFGETERKVLSREAGFPAAGASEKCSGPTGRVAQDVRPAGICTDWLGAMVTQERGDRLRELLDRQGGKLDLFCGCDQVGTPKVLTDAKGRVVKEITYDSFGVILHDTLPDLFMPIGFAGGLADSDTGLVRFGYRDYDPAVGRFTAPDPLGDTGGDHDLYDYCIDDPVTLNDPTGLFPPALYALALMGVRALPRLAGMASDLLLRGQAMLHTSKYGNGIITGATRAARFADGYLLPVSPVPASGTGMIGAVAARIVEAIQKQRDNEK